jgi:16S rRNA (uracil1498-N3)-methyltransferase
MDPETNVPSESLPGPAFYCPDLPDVGQHAALDAAEARHAAGVRRLREGDEVYLFDGAGGVARAVLGMVERRLGVQAQVQVRWQVPAPAHPLHLACALPKGDRQSVLLDMATQLGVAGFTALACERSVARPGGRWEERWRRICVEACKQSGRAWLPQLEGELRPLAAVQAALAAGREVWLAHPGGIPVAEAWARGDARRQAGLTVLVGPEGGFSPEEAAAVITEGAVAVSLGQTILRVETAAVALAAYARLAQR